MARINQEHLSWKLFIFPFLSSRMATIKTKFWLVGSSVSPMKIILDLFHWFIIYSFNSIKILNQILKYLAHGFGLGKGLSVTPAPRVIVLRYFCEGLDDVWNYRLVDNLIFYLLSHLKFQLSLHHLNHDWTASVFEVLILINFITCNILHLSPLTF